MNDLLVDEKVRQDAEKVKKDLNTLVGDGISNITEGFKKITGDAKETVADAAATVKKDVGHGLSQYNAKAQEYADKVPGELGEKVAKYPWVAVSVGLGIGLLLGGLIMPSLRPRST